MSSASRGPTSPSCHRGHAVGSEALGPTDKSATSERHDRDSRDRHLAAHGRLPRCHDDAGPKASAAGTMDDRAQPVQYTVTP